jgi:hypothetical protein
VCVCELKLFLSEKRSLNQKVKKKKIVWIEQEKERVFKYLIALRKHGLFESR